MPKLRDPRHLAVGALIVAGAVALLWWDGLQTTFWWYPETDAYQVWVVGLAALAVAAFVGARHRVWGAGWLGAITLTLSGLIALALHVARGYTPGDLFDNYLEGARRLRAGTRVYDDLGLQQSVNATPLALLLFVPFASLGNVAASVVSLGMAAAALLGFAFAGTALLRRIKGNEEGLADLGLVFCTLPTFFTFQRSWRLGQLDTILVALLAASVWVIGSGRSRAPAWAGLLTALAAGLKLAPGIAAVPLLLRSLGREDAPERRVARRFTCWLVGSGVVVALLCVIALGPSTVVDFVRALPGIGQGTTSGNNYALGARLITWSDRDARRDHYVPNARQRALQWALALAVLAAATVLTLRLRRTRIELLVALWLAVLPLASPLCWDIYLVWCGYLPWLVLWAALAGEWRRWRTPAVALRAVLCGGAYLLAGTAGNTAVRDLSTGVVVQLSLPGWLDEAPLVGHLLMLATLVWTAVVDHRRTPGEGAASWGLAME